MPNWLCPTLPHAAKILAPPMVAIKNLVKIVKYLEFPAKIYSSIAGNVVL